MLLRTWCGHDIVRDGKDGGMDGNIERCKQERMPRRATKRALEEKVGSAAVYSIHHIPREERRRLCRRWHGVFGNGVYGPGHMGLLAAYEMHPAEWLSHSRLADFFCFWM